MSSYAITFIILKVIYFLRLLFVTFNVKENYNRIILKKFFHLHNLFLVISVKNVISEERYLLNLYLATDILRNSLVDEKQQRSFNGLFIIKSRMTMKTKLNE